MSKKLSIREIKDKFMNEFSILESKFLITELNIDEVLCNEKNLNSPGVYVFWSPSHGVIKVGKSQSNSRKRALEHIRDNTHNSEVGMKDISSEEGAKLLLFNIKSNDDIHWLLSLEAFLELNISPVIKAGRIG